MDQSQQSHDSLVDELVDIKKQTFRVAVGVIFAIATMSVFARAAIRVKTRRRIFVDDYLLFIAAAFLVGSTGLIYYICDWLYLATALQNDPSIVSYLATQVVLDSTNTYTQNYDMFLIISWTAVFFAKFSFLAFFKQLIRKVHNIYYFYWAVVALTVVSWLFVASAPFIVCPEFGARSIICLDPSRSRLLESFTSVATGLDALSDVLTSLGIIVLHRAKIQNSQKISLGLFLCLSLVMVGISMVRVSKLSGASGLDIPRKLFWQYIEASVAVIMGSLTVFRSLLTLPTKSSNEQQHGSRVGVLGLRPHERFSHRMRFLRLKKDHIDLESQDGFPDIPRATMTGMRTFIRCNSRDPGLTDISQQSAVTVRECEDT
ncbi:hypothetical protein F4811DRAFT_569446 [Daldinia bambusicola]|nr:hypothetical protein F4811DRAFT_569446 [Daldinia bambusicola]